ncbi:hypothetical protein CH063_07678 [Colletotrichum higginsianum]|uniref:Uncharacterized protein n=1 Tax=Colletotrichum higginsianum (strain IMI 349063) TaxID=759273 RepID=H1V711_COLHI|nr:hypothetical protein CH063_07678 [Colletotrichum higginsianum]
MDVGAIAQHCVGKDKGWLVAGAWDLCRSPLWCGSGKREARGGREVSPLRDRSRYRRGDKRGGRTDGRVGKSSGRIPQQRLRDGQTRGEVEDTSGKRVYPPPARQIDSCFRQGWNGGCAKAVGCEAVSLPSQKLSWVTCRTGWWQSGSQSGRHIWHHHNTCASVYPPVPLQAVRN